MARMKLSVLALVGVAAALPPLPPSIPVIPGVTVPFAPDAPPLSIQQPVLPPRDSPPVTQSDIRPKKIGYFWTGAGNKRYKDFLVSYSLDDDTFGTLLRVVDVPSGRNEPHHLGPSADGKYLWGGGLLSLLAAQDTGFYFDTSDPYNPTFLKSDRAALSSIADDVNAKPKGGFFYTFMGSAAGTSPGRLVETDKNNNIIHEWPEDEAGLQNILGHQFSPHGLAVDYKNGFILTSDYVVPVTAIKPSPEVQGGDSLRLWDLKTRTILSTLTIPNAKGVQDVKFIPGNKEAAALATAVGPGEVWIIYPKRIDANGNQGVIKKFFGLGKNAANTVAIYSDITEDGKYAYFTYTTGNHIAQLDISNLDKPKRLDDPNKKQPIKGPHFVKVTPDGKHVMVFDYFLQTGALGNVNTPSDYKVNYIDINKDGSLHFNRSINVAKSFRKRGGAKPHSVAIFDLTDPANPKYV